MSDAENGAGERHLELFLDMMAAERGASANTLAAYRRDLKRLAQFLEKKAKA